MLHLVLESRHTVLVHLQFNAVTKDKRTALNESNSKVLGIVFSKQYNLFTNKPFS